MVAYHRRLFAFDHWASHLVLAAVEPVHGRVPRAVERLNHIVGASRVWLGRVTGTAAPYGLEASFAMADLPREFAAASRDWFAFFDTLMDDDLVRVIEYANGRRSTLADILTHIPIHGQHHRGQINADLRAAGVAPPRIDFIHASREGHI